MKKTLSLISFLIAIFAIQGFSTPDPDKTMTKDLNLTDAQQEQFEKITFEMKKKEIELKSKLATAALELKRLFTAESIDKSAIEKKMTDISALQVALRMNQLTAWSDKNKLLNAEQQKTWRKMLNNHLRQMRDRMQENMHNQMKRNMRKRMHSPMMDRSPMDNDDMPPPMERRIEKQIIK